MIEVLLFDFYIYCGDGVSGPHPCLKTRSEIWKIES